MQPSASQHVQPIAPDAGRLVGHRAGRVHETTPCHRHDLAAGSRQGLLLLAMGQGSVAHIGCAGIGAGQVGPGLVALHTPEGLRPPLPAPLFLGENLCRQVCLPAGQRLLQPGGKVRREKSRHAV